MKLTLNLASRRYLNRRALYGSYALIIVVLVLVLALNLNLYLRSRDEAHRLESRLAGLARQLNGEQEAAVAGYSPQAYTELLDEIDFANEILIKDSFRWTRLLDRLEEVTPKRVLISSIQPSFEDDSLKNVKIAGQTRSVDDLRHFIDNLVVSPHFTEVYLFNQARVLSDRGHGGNINYTIDLKGEF